ncbi:MAG: glycosyltransferase [Cyanobacteriota bacterium]
MSTTPLSVNIVAQDNASGLTRDVQIIMEALNSPDFELSWCSACRPGLRHQFPRQMMARLEQLLYRARYQQPRYDVNLFVEGVVPWWFPFARFNLLIPNQDWFHGYWQPYLKYFDYILCKTHLAERVFSPWGQTYYIGFTSSDRRDWQITPNYDMAFHLGSDRVRLGTKLILQVWQQHPEFPQLTLISQNLPPTTQRAKNINIINQFIPEPYLIRLQNQHGVHIYATRIEGFGHRIMEAMSASAATVTTDAPPMNELVTPERGLLIPYNRTTPQNWGTRYHVDVKGLTKTLETLWGSTTQTRQTWGEQGRAYYEDSRRGFQQRLLTILKNL